MRKILSLLLILIVITSTAAYAQPAPTPVPTQDSAQKKANESGKAYLEIIDYPAYIFTTLNGHFYGVQIRYDDREQYYYAVLMEDDKDIYEFREDYNPSSIAQLKGSLYLSLGNTIYKFENGKPKEFAKLPGIIGEMGTTGEYLYASCIVGRYGVSNYHSKKFYIISTDGSIYEYPGGEHLTYWCYTGFSVNKDLDRLACLSSDIAGVVIRRDTGKVEIQRTREWWDFPDDDYTVYHVLYYNNCLLANAKGSLVYYDEDNQRQVLLGDMKGTWIYFESFRCQPGNSAPIKTGLGEEVRLGYVAWWTIGDDGYIYGRTMESWDKYHSFRLAIPDSVKEVVTYKKQR